MPIPQSCRLTLLLHSSQACFAQDLYEIHVHSCADQGNPKNLPIVHLPPSG